MVDRVLEGQQKMTVDFNGKIDGLYINLNTKFENLSTHVKKLESQVLQTSDTIRRHEGLIKEKMESGVKHHVNALLDDNFWQEVRRENLQEGDFRVESSMSFGSSHWCRSTPSLGHRSMSTAAASVASCESTNIARRSNNHIDRHGIFNNDRRVLHDIDRRDQRPSRSLSIDSQLLTHPTTQSSEQGENASETMEVDRQDEGHFKKEKKIPKHQRREASEKEIDSFTKRVLRIPLDVPFDEAYYTHRLWMFFRETRETDDDIETMFNHLREKKKQKVGLKKKKSDPGKFVVPCMIKNHQFPNALCDTGSSVSIIPRAMAEKLNLRIEPSRDSFIFVDCSRVDSGGICRDVPLQIQNALIPVDFHVMDIQINWSSALLLGRAFMATVGAICDMHTNRLCLSLIDNNVFYDTYKNKPALTEIRDNAELVATCFCHYDRDEESDEGESIDTQPRASIDIRKRTTIDLNRRPSIDISIPDPIYNYHADFRVQPRSH